MKDIHEILAAIFSAKEKPKKECPCGCKGSCGCLDSQAEARTMIRRIQKMRKVRMKGSRRVLK